MGCLTICSVLVPLLAIVAPIAMSAAFDGRFWDVFPAWDVKDMPDLSGKVAIITGPTVGGIGFESAAEMAKKGAQVILAGRSEAKGNEALKLLLQRIPHAKAEFMKLDLGSLQSVKDFADQFGARNLPLHILLNNAGVMANPFTLTVDGLESQFGTNHIGHFLLTKLLLPHLEALHVSDADEHDNTLYGLLPLHFLCHENAIPLADLLAWLTQRQPWTLTDLEPTTRPAIFSIVLTELEPTAWNSNPDDSFLRRLDWWICGITVNLHEPAY
ncbi:unnamed protein product [Durusdinium trenchii]|uniref:Protochlorophyllide reductase n=1 Tax=Durusdinium trenchii TaxID=1381693 RepID=A0ABP0KT43_9DINO